MQQPGSNIFAWEFFDNDTYSQTNVQLAQDPFDDDFDPMSIEMDNLVEVLASSNPDASLRAMVAALQNETALLPDKRSKTVTDEEITVDYFSVCLQVLRPSRHYYGHVETVSYTS